MARSPRAALINERDPYLVLGLTPHASSAEIEKARRRVAALHHPDTGPASERAERELAMKRINVAYELLRDPTARASYDLAQSTALPQHAAPPPLRRTTAAPSPSAFSAPASSPTRATPPRARRRPKRTQTTAVRPLQLLRAIGFLLSPLLGSRLGLYALLLGAVGAALELAPRADQLPIALGTGALALLLPPLLLRRLRGTPAGDLFDFLRELVP